MPPKTPTMSWNIYDCMDNKQGKKKGKWMQNKQACNILGVIFVCVKAHLWEHVQKPEYVVNTESTS